MSFSAEQRERLADLWERMLGHRFLHETRDALVHELTIFEEEARKTGVDFAGMRSAFITHAYIQFLTAAAHAVSYAEAYTALYVAESAYYESWRVVHEGIAADSKWLPFVDNWAGEAFGQYVAYLEHELDQLAGGVGVAERERMAELFELPTRYEIAFWAMAINGETWPRIPEAR